ncbi:MAG: SRPBCC domain-containing protein, partial [bacterium]|nr:SRPBCC domain-containing protein [bacterium]
MKMIHSYIEIESSCEDIWNILLDFKSYPDWNPFIKEIQGEAKTGSRLKVSLHAPELKPKDFTPVVNMVWENKQFRWTGKLAIPGLFAGEHMFILEELDPRKVR